MQVFKQDSNASKLICCVRTEYLLKKGVSNTDPGEGTYLYTHAHVHPNAFAYPDPLHNAHRRQNFQRFGICLVVKGLTYLSCSTA